MPGQIVSGGEKEWRNKSSDVKNPGYPRNTNTVTTWCKTDVLNSSTPQHSRASSVCTATEPSIALGSPQFSIREDVAPQHDIALQSVVVEKPPLQSGKPTLLELSSIHKGYKNPIYDRSLAD